MVKTDRRFLLIPLCVFFFQYPCCFSPKETTYSIPNSILQEIDRAVDDGNFSCDKKALFSRNFFSLNDERLLILIGIPDYLCASNSFMPVVVDDQGKWLAGAIMPGAPSWIVLGPDRALWLVAQWQIEGTFPALYRSLNGVDWQEITLPEDREVDCCFERLERICFHQRTMRLEFASAETGKTACWQAEVSGLAGGGRLAPQRRGRIAPQRRGRIAPQRRGLVWQKIAAEQDGNRETPCPLVPLGQGSWTREESSRSGWIIFKKSSRHSKIAVVIPNSLE